MEWISLKTEVPTKEVLAFGYQGEMLIGYISEAESPEGYICENDNEILPKVTHWMPLPEPPKE